MRPQESIKAWFTILEERGEYSHFTVIERDEKGIETTTDLFHGEMDGIGGFLSIMKKRGETSFLMPNLPLRARPHALVYALNFIRYLARLPFYSPGWKLKTDWNHKTEKPTASAWCSLSVEDTKKIWDKARSARVGRNAFLLHHLDLAVAPYLKESIFPRYWLIPVNLRTDFSSHEGNVTGFVDARITKSTNLQDLDKNLKRSLNRGEALGGYVGLTLGRYVGPVILKALVIINDFIQVRTGVLTNLGNWVTASGTEMKSHWYGLPPVIAAQPFGAMTGSMNGEQTLTVIFHPRLTRSKELANECLARWVKSLLEA